MSKSSPGARPTKAPPENFTWGPLYPLPKRKVRWFYSECDFHAILHFVHIRAILKMNEPDGYVFTQNANASDFASTYVPKFEIYARILMHFCM